MEFPKLCTFCTVPPQLVSSMANQHDREIISTFENIIGRNLSNRQCQQLTLSIKNGGFGLTAATETANSAFLGAWANTLANLPDREQRLDNICSALMEDFDIGHMSITLDLQEALHELHRSSNSAETILPSLKQLTERPKNLQSRLHTVKKDTLFQQFLQSCPDKEDRSRLISSGGAFAGKWLEAIPCSQPFTLSHAQFCTAAFVRLGVSLPQLSKVHKCVPQCGQEVDDKGYHLLTCKFGGGPIRRHDHFLDCYYDMLRSIDFRCRKELTAQFRGKQRPDIAVYNYQDGKKLLLDVTITHPWAKMNLSGSSEKAGFATSVKEKEKNRKYLATATSLGHLFRPIAIEVYGRWGGTAEETLKEASQLAPSILGIPYGQFKTEWSIRLATCLQKENAEIINNKLLSIVGKKTGVNQVHQPISRCFSFRNT